MAIEGRTHACSSITRGLLTGTQEGLQCNAKTWLVGRKFFNTFVRLPAGPNGANATFVWPEAWEFLALSVVVLTQTNSYGWAS